MIYVMTNKNFKILYALRAYIILRFYFTTDRQLKAIAFFILLGFSARDPRRGA